MAIVEVNTFGGTKQERMMKLGERVRAERQARQMTVAALAERSGLTKGFISQVETGRSNPSIESLRRLADALSVPPGALFAVKEQRAGAGGLLESKLPIVTRRRESSSGNAPVELPSPGGSRLFAVNLVSGAQAISDEGESAREAGHAFCLVFEGEVVFSEGETEISLARGDTLTWDARSPFSFSNRGIAQAALLVAVKEEQAPPLQVTPSEAPKRWPQKEVAARGAAEGPLRLVAMRAERDRRKRGAP